MLLPVRRFLHEDFGGNRLDQICGRHAYLAYAIQKSRRTMEKGAFALGRVSVKMQGCAIGLFIHGFTQ